MRKIVFIGFVTISTLFAFDIGGALKNVGNSALNGNTDKSSLIQAATGISITPESLGEQLAEVVKSNKPENLDVNKAKELCTQTSTLKIFAASSSDILDKAITVCSEKVLAN